MTAGPDVLRRKLVPLTLSRSTDARQRHGFSSSGGPYPHNPDYAIDVIEGAKPISTQLSVATSLFAVLLIAMSAVAAPMRPQDPVAGRTDGNTQPRWRYRRSEIAGDLLSK